jgi:hypothetical protein
MSYDILALDELLRKEVGYGNYASTAYMKLGVRNREEAIQKALEAGFF